MVFNDGATYTQPDGYYRAVNVLDNLIHRGELPVMIAAFIDPGKFTKDGASNRQAEYDPPDDRYSRVIVDELLPRVYAEYRITRDPEHHAIAGSGGTIRSRSIRTTRSSVRFGPESPLAETAFQLQVSLISDHLPGFVVAQPVFRTSAGGGEPGGPGSSAIRPRRIVRYSSLSHSRAGSIDVVMLDGGRR